MIWTKFGPLRQRRAWWANGDPAGKTFLALPTWIEIAPDAEIKGKGVEGRPDAAVDIDLGRRMIDERNALG